MVILSVSDIDLKSGTIMFQWQLFTKLICPKTSSPVTPFLFFYSISIATKEILQYSK